MNILQKKVLPDTVYKMSVYICLRNLGLNFCCIWALWVRVNMILHDSHLFVYPRTNVTWHIQKTLKKQTGPHEQKTFIDNSNILKNIFDWQNIFNSKLNFHAFFFKIVFWKILRCFTNYLSRWFYPLKLRYLITDEKSEGKKGELPCFIIGQWGKHPLNVSVTWKEEQRI